MARKLKSAPVLKQGSASLAIFNGAGSPMAFYCVLGTRFGVKAVELIKNKKFGQMVALSGNKIIDVSLQEAVKALKTVDSDLYDIERILWIIATRTYRMVGVPPTAGGGR